jgi:hypothetical protein
MSGDFACGPKEVIRFDDDGANLAGSRLSLRHPGVAHAVIDVFAPREVGRVVGRCAVRKREMVKVGSERAACAADGPLPHLVTAKWETEKTK